MSILSVFKEWKIKEVLLNGVFNEVLKDDSLADYSLCFQGHYNSFKCSLYIKDNKEKGNYEVHTEHLTLIVDDCIDKKHAEIIADELTKRIINE